jgi:lipoyl(octanoyl) transferase
MTKAEAMSARALVTRLPVTPYERAWELQLGLRAARQRGEVPDLLLLLEHPPVLTKGRRTEDSELGMGEEWYRMQGIEVCETDRGGRVTYHGPGQLVAYPIVDLTAADRSDDVHTYVRGLEEVMIAALDDHGVPAQVFDGLTGVWTEGNPPIEEGSPGPQGSPVRRAHGTATSGEAGGAGGTGSVARKIGSIGVHVSRGITTHGLAVNVNNDLQPFEWIVPCGIDYVKMTSLGAELGAEQDLEAFAATVAERFAEIFDRALEPVDPAQLYELAGMSRLSLARR